MASRRDEPQFKRNVEMWTDEDNRKWMWGKTFSLLYQLCVPSTKSQPISSKADKRANVGKI